MGIFFNTKSEERTRAYKFALKAHRGQTRKDGTMYIHHPVEVATIVNGHTDDNDTVIAAMLHDVIEDTEYTYEDIKIEFGERVADLVRQVTKDSKGEFHIRSGQAFLIKLADIIHNLSDSEDEKYIKEKRNWVKENVPIKILNEMADYTELAYLMEK